MLNSLHWFMLKCPFNAHRSVMYKAVNVLHLNTRGEYK